MIWYFLIGGALIVWTLLLLMAGERQHRLNEIEIKRHNERLIAEKQRKREAQIPVVG